MPRIVNGCMEVDRETAEAVEKQMGIPGVIKAYEDAGKIKVIDPKKLVPSGVAPA